jgi:hypothetical protein
MALEDMVDTRETSGALVVWSSLAHYGHWVERNHKKTTVLPGDDDVLPEKHSKRRRRVCQVPTAATPTPRVAGLKVLANPHASQTHTLSSAGGHL